MLAAYQAVVACRGGSSSSSGSGCSSSISGRWWGLELKADNNRTQSFGHSFDTHLRALLFSFITLLQVFLFLQHFLHVVFASLTLLFTSSLLLWVNALFLLFLTLLVRSFLQSVTLVLSFPLLPFSSITSYFLHVPLYYLTRSLSLLSLLIRSLQSKTLLTRSLL